VLRFSFSLLLQNDAIGSGFSQLSVDEIHDLEIDGLCARSLF
jgi:hypothetical protein